MRLRTALFFVAASFALLGVVPLSWTYGAAVWERAGELGDLVASATLWLPLVRGLLLATLTAVGAIVLAAPLAFFTGRVRFRGRRLIAAAALVPLALPPYNAALVLRRFLPAEPLLASSVVLALALYPIVFVYLRAGLASVDPVLEEAARLARGTRETLQRVTWPLIRAWALASSGIVFLLGLGEPAVPGFLGLPVYANQIVLRFAATYDAAGAAITALPLLCVVLLLLVAEARLLRRVDVFASRARPPLVFDSTGWRHWPPWLCLAIVALSPGFPLLLTVLELDGDGVTRALPMVVRPGVTSLIVAGFGGLGALVCGFALALLRRRRAGGFLWAPLAFFVIPGAVLGVGLIGFWNRPMPFPVYGSVIILVLAVILRYTVIAERSIDAGLASVPATQEQVARLSGRGDGAVVSRVLAPQIGTAIVAGLVAFVLFALRDLDTVVTIYPPGSETLAVRLFTVAANAPRGLLAAVSIAQVALTLPVVLVLAAVMRKSRWLF